jgi:hypothetical protein
MRELARPVHRREIMGSYAVSPSRNRNAYRYLRVSNSPVSLAPSARPRPTFGRDRRDPFETRGRETAFPSPLVRGRLGRTED